MDSSNTNSSFILWRHLLKTTDISALIHIIIGCTIRIVTFITKLPGEYEGSCWLSNNFNGECFQKGLYKYVTTSVAGQRGAHVRCRLPPEMVVQVAFFGRPLGRVTPIMS